MSDTVNIRPERAGDEDAIDAVVLAAFGPGRFAKAAERLREGNRHLPALSHVVGAPGGLLGTCRIWPVACELPGAVLLGPIAVLPARRGEGLAAQLLGETLSACDRAGVPAVICVGDDWLFGAHGFGVNTGEARLPGPVDPQRVLVRGHGGARAPAINGPLSVPRGARPA